MNAEQTAEASSLLARAAGGDMDAWGALLAGYYRRLMNVADFRLAPSLRGRIDPADVTQEALLAATERRAEFFAQSAQPLFLWLRWMVGNTLLEVHRHHLGAQMRDPRREVVVSDRGSNRTGRADDDDDHSTRAALAAQLTCGITGPATAAAHAEVKARVCAALAQMGATDREVVALRHFEQLTSAETAQVLGIQERAAAKRYLRAMGRLRDILAETPGGLTGMRP